MRVFLATIIVMTATACQESVPAPAVQPADRLFGEETFTIRYRGRMPEVGPGEKMVTENVRAWGHQRTWIAEGPNALRMIFEDGRRYVFDPFSDAIFWSDDTATAELVSRIGDNPERNYGYRRASIMFDGHPTGETAVIAGHECAFYEGEMPSGMAHVRVCNTDWGATLHVTMTGAAEFMQIAEDVRIGDGGSDGVFRFDRAAAQEHQPTG